MLTAAARGPVAAVVPGPTPAVRAVMALSLGLAAVIHALVVDEHLHEWALAGTFFLALELVEGVLAVAVVAAWSRAIGWAVVTVSLATLALWSLSRTAGLPIGPSEARVPEGMGPADLACSVLELTAELLAVWCLAPTRGRTWPAGVRRVVVGALGAACLAVASWGVHGALADAPHHASETSVATSVG